ncbi:MAG: acyl carrier protein [Candidatus Aminicenantales bacterium]
MSELNDRLIRCFSAVFPRLAIEDIPAARLESVEEWDSLAALRLVAVLEEEFGLRIDLSDLQELSSFKTIERYLLKRGDVS